MAEATDRDGLGQAAGPRPQLDTPYGALSGSQVATDEPIERPFADETAAEAPVDAAPVDAAPVDAAPAQEPSADESTAAEASTDEAASGPDAGDVDAADDEPADDTSTAETADEPDDVEPTAEAADGETVDHAAETADGTPAAVEPADEAEDEPEPADEAEGAEEAEGAAEADEAEPVADQADEAEPAEAEDDAKPAEDADDAEPAVEPAAEADAEADKPAEPAEDAGERSAEAPAAEAAGAAEAAPEVADAANAPVRRPVLGATNVQPALAVPPPTYTNLPVNHADDPTSSWTAKPAEETVRFDRVPAAPADDHPRSPLEQFEAEPEHRRWPRTLAIVAGALVVLGGAYVGASYALGDKVPRGTTVAGVDIGGLASDAAVARLHDQIADGSGQPIPVVVGQKSSELQPADAGLTFDARATVDRLTGVDLAQPARLWHQVVGLGEQPPTASVDAAKLKAAVANLDGDTAEPPVDGAITFVGGIPHTTAAVDGTSIDQPAARDVLSRTWLSAPRPITLPTRQVAPAISQEEADRAMREIAQPLTISPVSVQVAGQIAVLQPAQLTAAATIAPKGHSLVLTMDGNALAADVGAQVPSALTAATDASFQFQNDQPVIVPGQPGQQIDANALATSVAGAAVTTNRTVSASLVPTDPAQSTAALEALGIKEIVSEFDTPLTADHIRDINIAQGAKNITGVLVKPGETFSLIKALGPIDAAHGFVPAGAIVDGQHTDAMGGGLSQLSTTTYNAAYFAGFKDIAHTPHSEWFSRYPEGRESTVFAPTIDMKWQNTSPYGALVQAWIADGRTHVRIWGTKYWTVDSTTSARSGVVQPTTVYDTSATCEASAAGNPGFTVTVTRHVSLDGVLKSTDSHTTRYKPQNKTVCGPKPATPSAAPTP
jgi:vancomycin resistance protein YoaR